MNYYAGGLAELNPNPSALTCFYFKQWFTGQTACGKAMKLLGLPFTPAPAPLLEVRNDTLVVNLDVDEAVLYATTIFSYQKNLGLGTEPKLVPVLSKLINPWYWSDTLKILFRQSLWLGNPKATLKLAHDLVSSLPSPAAKLDHAEINHAMTDSVWPVVIAIGMLAEYFYRACNNREDQTYISHQAAKKDWFINSFIDQGKVKSGFMSFNDYLELYGYRADNDYELTSPRWWEIRADIQKRINTFKVPSRTVPETRVVANVLLTSAIELQELRSQSRQKALLWFNLLRQATLATQKMVLPTRSKKKVPLALSIAPKFGTGQPVSSGTVSGTTKQVVSGKESIPPETIGIFPTASTQFTTQYSHCVGIIFLQGGQTSHGAIVAREFGIPAIIDPLAQTIPENVQLLLDGATGKWHT